MLKIKNLHAKTGKNEILQGVDLEVKPGTIHAIMGPNGSGKSTFAKVLAGHEDVVVTSGSVEFFGENLLTCNVEERAQKGIFFGLQNPTEIPGVNNMYFLRTALNSLREKRGESALDAFDFMKIIKEKSQVIGFDEAFLKRGVNEGFSGGEKKRNEILQMLLLEPRLVILDEIDSGLDIDALQAVAAGVNHLRSKERAFILITHYQRLLNYITPDFVHVWHKGKIVKSGGKELAVELEKSGYGWLEK